MYEKLKQLICDLDAMNISPRPFIGYGNPDANILIVGKECAWESNSEDWLKFYEPNFRHWKESFDRHGFRYEHGGNPYDFQSGNFHPIWPFYRQYNTTKKNCNGTSKTYFYYQRLIDKIQDREPHEYIDFFENCFITELNDICRKKDAGLSKEEHKETEEHIRMRFDWIRKTNFFNQFKVVILACGPYSKKIREDDILRRDLFGDAFVVYCHQLSFWDKTLEKQIPEIRTHLNTLRPCHQKTDTEREETINCNRKNEN